MSESTRFEDEEVECRACAAGLPLIWCVQSRKTVHLRGLATFACARIDARAQRARDVRWNEDQRGR